MTDKTQAHLPVTPEGPRITVKASCFDCPFVVSESYRVQSDSGSNVYCAHPSFEKRQRVGDTVWDTPDFCPVTDIPAIRAALTPSAPDPKHPEIGTGLPPLSAAPSPLSPGWTDKGREWLADGAPMSEPVQKLHELPEGHRWCRHCEQKDPHCSVCEGVGYLPPTLFGELK